jgi:prepilin-type processing-associated H-X9-DG protein
VRLQQITDGTSNTFLFGELTHYDPEYDRLRLGWPYPEQCNLKGGCGYWPPVALWCNGFRTTHSRLNYRVPSGLTPAPPPVTDWLAVPADTRAAWVAAQRSFGSEHPGGANFAFADGSVRFVRDSIDLATYRELSTIASGNPVGGDF